MDYNTIVNTIFAQKTGVIWYPLVLVGVLVLLYFLIFLWGRLFFRRDYNKESKQVKPFNSGNLDEIDYNVQGSNLYWGFRKALDAYYEKMEKIHSGNLNDYMKWLVIVLAVSLLLIVLGGEI
ncbi:MAG: hydrogenase [bacterium]|nr:hydrogenase [bacterium]